MKKHPYKDLPSYSFWRTSVSNVNCLDINDLWKPKFKISQKDPVISFGSCFAQHMSRALVSNGFNWLNCEKGIINASDSLLREYNYGIFSARTGNIYTTKQLYQWVAWSLGEDEIPPDLIWEKGNRFFDPLRPSIEPKGFKSKDELYASRSILLSSLKKCFTQCDLFVFTLGLTEGWECKETGVNYAQAPGVVAGSFDEEKHAFKNYSYEETYTYLEKAIDLLCAHNSAMNFLLTVSPVPLISTASKQHVLVANSFSKSVLRCVAGQLVDKYPNVDYFPSYEIVTQPPFRGMFYNPDLRTICESGVKHIMEIFISSLMNTNVANPVEESSNHELMSEPRDQDSKCEEELIEAFAFNVAGADND